MLIFLNFLRLLESVLTAYWRSGIFAFFSLFISHGAFLFQHHQKFLICSKGFFGIFYVFLCLCIFFIGVSKLSCFFVNLLLASCNFGFFCCLQLLISLLVF